MALMRPLEQWPLVLCGPMLRRVEANAVTVFVALKSSCHVTLRVHRQSAPAEMDVAYGTAETVTIGTRLHVLAITAEPTNGYLQPGVTYSYDLAFESATATVGSLVELPQFQGAESLGYTSSADLPTFELLPDHYADLRLLHASCRLPHAEGRDVLPGIDSILEECLLDSELVRPQALFLTGDQIYADDVAPSMLRMAAEIGKTALGWTEILPDGLDATSFDLAPERRAPVLSRYGFTSDAAHSHLITFAEFVGMYLLVWSGELWPRASGDNPPLPAVEEVFHHAQWRDQEDPLREKELLDATQKYLNTAATLNGFRFHEALPKVRRALANIPTYMMWDDHEVTDDWNIYEEWIDEVYGSSLGPRLVRNAQAAYAVFQAWGNDPARFRPGTAGGDLLDRLSTWRGAEDASAQRIAVRLGLPSTLPEVPAVRWDYEVASATYGFIVLDTRTLREFPRKRRASRLMSDSAKRSQLLDKRRLANEITFIVSPAPIIGHPLVEGLVQPLVKIWSGAKGVDYEAWLFHRPCFESLLSDLVPFGRVVVLSGDVHYGFSASVDYWRESGTPTTARFVQLTASGLKNQTFKTRSVASRVAAPDDQAVLGWPSDRIVIGRKQHPRTGHLQDIYPNPGTPGLLMFPEHWEKWGADQRGVLPGWRYRVRFASDQRQVAQRGLVEGPLSHGQYADHGANRWVVGHNNFGEVTFLGDDVIRHSLWYAPKVRSFVLPYTVHDMHLSLPAVNASDKPDITSNAPT